MWRVVWQYKSSLTEHVDTTSLASSRHLIALSDRHLAGMPFEVEPQPVFNLAQHASSRRASARLALQRADPIMDLAGYHHALVKDRHVAQELARRLAGDPHIRYSDVQGQWRTPARFIKTRILDDLPAASIDIASGAIPDYTSIQNYLDPAPAGIDARYAWTQKGGRGASIKLVDIEAGWNIDHIELPTVNREPMYGAINGPSVSPNDICHGTAVLSIFAGNNNAIGVSGIASDADVFAASASWGHDDSPDQQWRWNVADAIHACIDHLGPGDIILLEMHCPGPNSPGVEELGFVAIEYWDDQFAAVQTAVNAGITVIEAAGNGSENLDAAIYGGRFSTAVRDSGAILVGAGFPAIVSKEYSPPHSRFSWSNYGSRVDLQGWGGRYRRRWRPCDQRLS